MNTLTELWQFRELFYFLAWRDVKVRYKQTIIGILWAILQPMLTMIVFTVLFGRIAGISTNGIPRPIFYYAALLPWTYFATTLASAGNSLVQNTNLVTKVYFPRFILPASVSISGLLDFFVGSSLLIGLIAWYKVPLGLTIIAWPLLVIPLLIFTLGVGLLLASMNVKYRDVKYAIPFLIQVWLFLTPVIYPSSMIPEKWRWVTSLNPMSGIIEGFRWSVVPSSEVRPGAILLSFATSAVVFVVGFLVFRRTEREFADIV